MFIETAKFMTGLMFTRNQPINLAITFSQFYPIQNIEMNISSLEKWLGDKDGLIG